jgi:hypothetical protein
LLADAGGDWIVEAGDNAQNPSISVIAICTKPLARRTLPRARRQQCGRFRTFQTGKA